MKKIIWRNEFIDAQYVMGAKDVHTGIQNNARTYLYLNTLGGGRHKDIEGHHTKEIMDFLENAKDEDTLDLTPPPPEPHERQPGELWCDWYERTYGKVNSPTASPGGRRSRMARGSRR